MPFIGGGIAAAGIGTSIIGAMEAGDAREAAERQLQANQALYSGIQIPDIEQMKLDLEMYKMTGEMTPALEQALQEGPSAYEKIKTDPRLRAQQYDTLNALKELSKSGLNASDKAALQQIATQTQRQVQANQQSILQNRAQRGIAGGGDELAAQMMAAQQGAESQQAQGLQQGDISTRRALEALSQGGQMAGQVRGQENQEQAQLAQARQAIEDFNIRNRQDVMRQNINRENIANEYNVKTKQALANANVDQRNFQQQYNKELAQRKFDNEIRRAAGISGANVAYGNSLIAGGQQKAQMWGGIGSALTQGIGSFAQPSAPIYNTQTGEKINKYDAQTGKPLYKGGVVPGPDLPPGDHPENDIVQANLSPGEIVIPRSVALSPNAPEKSAKFVQKELEKNKKKDVVPDKKDDMYNVKGLLALLNEHYELKSKGNK